MKVAVAPDTASKLPPVCGVGCVPRGTNFTPGAHSVWGADALFNVAHVPERGDGEGVSECAGGVPQGDAVEENCLWSSTFILWAPTGGGREVYIVHAHIIMCSIQLCVKYSLGFLQRGGHPGIPPQLEFPPSHSPRLINGSTHVTTVHVQTTTEAQNVTTD